MRKNRIKSLLGFMEKKGVEVTLINSSANRLYFSGFPGSAGYLLIQPNDTQKLLTDFRYRDQAKTEAEEYEVIVEKPPLLGAAGEQLQKLKVKKVGIEYNQISLNDFLFLKQELPHVEFVDIESEIMEIRMIKDETEIDSFRKGIHLCDLAFDHILHFIQPGITEKDIGLELEYFMKKHGAQGIKENHVIVSGERGALPHGQATDRVIQLGDFITMDYGAKNNGYYTDFTRTVVVGEPNDKQKEIYEIVKHAQEEAIKAIKPGKACNELDEVGRSIIREAGYGELFGHSLGHSLGLHIHERPTMRSTDITLLQPGMVITVEPGIYIPGFGGVRIEDLIVIRPDGIENLTTSTKELQIVGVS
ncbi:Xaa-Pro peptidase family protein [Bacillaceae bacterium S4-13-58]